MKITKIISCFIIFNIFLLPSLFAGKACNSAYVKKRFQLIAKMATAEKRKDFFNYVKYQYLYSQYLSTERLMKEYNRGIQGEESRDFYVRFNGKKTPMELDAILTIFSERNLFCTRKDKNSPLELFGIDELEEFIMYIE